MNVSTTICADPSSTQGVTTRGDKSRGYGTKVI